MEINHLHRSFHILSTLEQMKSLKDILCSFMVPFLLAFLTYLFQSIVHFPLTYVELLIEDQIMQLGRYAEILVCGYT